MRASVRSKILVVLCASLAFTVPPAAQGPPSSQEQALTASLAPFALLPDAIGASEPAFECATGLVWAIDQKIMLAEPLTNGSPLFFDQDPRLLRSDHTGAITLRNFLIVGDVPTVVFQRVAPDVEGGLVPETWERTGTRTIDGRVISVFTPTWANSVWEAFLGRRSLENSRPWAYWGYLEVPEQVTAADAAATPVKRYVYLNTRVGDLPSATVTQIDPTVQFASHVVNLVIPGFGDSRVAGGDTALDLTAVTRKYFEHFQDNNDALAVVSQSNHIGGFGAFHQVVKNDVQGLALPLFDNSASYGSGGALKAVEFYPYNTFGTNATSNHEVGHQWEDYWNWNGLTNGIEMKGHAPDAHTPLLHPGEVLTGAVLDHDRRVAQQAAALQTSHGPTYVIEQSPAPQTYNRLALYRMGLIPASDVPAMQVFEEQGQFDAETSSSPDAGKVLTGGHREVHINAIMGMHGTRSGPVDTDWRRATVVVSRDGLISKEEMDYWNAYAVRHAVASNGVRDYGGLGNFQDATQTRAAMNTDVTPKSAPKITATPNVAYPNMLATDFRGIQLDGVVPGRITVGQRVALAGRVTATDRSDFTSACFRFRRDGQANPNEIFFCGSISGNRFSTGYTFTDVQRGRYILDAFLFFDSSSQFPRGIAGIIYVE